MNCSYTVERRGTATALLTLKNRLGKFCSDQELPYDYEANLHGIGNSSVV